LGCLGECGLGDLYPSGLDLMIVLTGFRLADKHESPPPLFSSFFGGDVWGIAPITDPSLLSPTYIRAFISLHCICRLIVLLLLPRPRRARPTTPTRPRLRAYRQRPVDMVRDYPPSSSSLKTARSRLSRGIGREGRTRSGNAGLGLTCLERHPRSRSSAGELGALSVPSGSLSRGAVGAV